MAYIDPEIEAALIASVLSGNKEDFSRLVTGYKGLVYSILSGMINSGEDVHDLAQEVFIKVYTNMESYNPAYKFSSWITRITTNTCIDFLRKNKKTVLVQQEKYDIKDSKPGPEEMLIKKEDEHEVMKAIESLPEMYRAILVLYHHQGLSYEQICKVANLPETKVKNRLYRARKMLKERLETKAKGGRTWIVESLII